jgi:hypothetical protein
MIGSDIVTRLRLVVNDADAIRWTSAEIVLWINDACRFIALKRPDSCSVNGVKALSAGSKQTVADMTPAGVRVLDVVRAIATGRAIRLVDREVLDTQLPTWHSATAGVPTNWVFDNRDPKNFYVYPPAAPGTQIELIYSRVPVALANESDLSSVVLSPDDIYIDPLVNYVLYRLYGKDADFAQNAQLSAGYLAACRAALGDKTGADVAFSPDFNSAGGRPTPGAASGAGA